MVLSRKGGAGKTTTTLMLGHTFATHRGDRVVALDANPDAGSLAYRVRRETTETVTSLLSEGHDLDRYARRAGLHLAVARHAARGRRLRRRPPDHADAG